MIVFLCVLDGFLIHFLLWFLLSLHFFSLKKTKNRTEKKRNEKRGVKYDLLSYVETYFIIFFSNIYISFLIWEFWCLCLIVNSLKSHSLQAFAHLINLRWVWYGNYFLHFFFGQELLPSFKYSRVYVAKWFEILFFKIILLVMSVGKVYKKNCISFFFYFWAYVYVRLMGGTWATHIQNLTNELSFC